MFRWQSHVQTTWSTDLLGKKGMLISCSKGSKWPSRFGSNIGRGMKVNKEEIIGMYVAPGQLYKTDHAKRMEDISRER